jgi:DNA invertase Pin-like site-specific DNA recombinase
MGMLSAFRAKSAAEQRVEARLGRPVADLIKDGLEAGQSHSAIAKSLGVSRQTLERWIAIHGLTVRIVVEKVA